jgi:hypothetical protein
MGNMVDRSKSLKGGLMNNKTDWKENWKTLKKKLEREVRLTDDAIKSFVREKNYEEASQFSEEKDTVLWVLYVMRNIEKTGETP